MIWWLFYLNLNGLLVIRQIDSTSRFLCPLKRVLTLCTIDLIQKNSEYKIKLNQIYIAHIDETNKILASKVIL